MASTMLAERLLLGLWFAGVGWGQTVEYRDVAISPDGARVAWVEKQEKASRLLVLNRTAPDAKPVQVETGEVGSPAWPPGSDRIAFVKEDKGQGQVWVAGSGGEGARALTSVRGYVARPRWSPDGKRIAFLHIEGASGGGPLGATEAQVGEIGSAIRNQLIAVADAASGTVRMASPPELHVYDFDWSRDGARFAVTAAPGPGDNNWWVARLYTVESSSGQARSIYTPKRQIAVPRWSPDGKRVAFIEGLMSDEGFHGGDLMTVDATGGSARNHTAARKSSPSWMTWLSPGELLFTEYVGGGNAIAVLDVQSGAVERLWQGAERMTAGGFGGNFSLAVDGRTSAVVRSSFETPPEVWAGPIGGWRAVTSGNSGLKPSWGRAESVEWSSEGWRVQGWLLHPPVERPGTKYPMVVDIHGGPSGAVTPAWPEETSLVRALSLQGYFVLLPNPRGSYGQGEAFTVANVKDFGGGDLRDILAGVDAVTARFSVDGKRLGVTGWSYGGYMTMWTVTQTARFRAAVAGAGIANWQSYYGQNSIDQWMIPFFGATVYDDPAVYEKSSPIKFIKNVKTPTLVVVGERDAECPAPQSFEFWHALRTLGVPAKLVVYPGEGHMFTDPEHKADLLKRTVGWFEEHLRVE